MSSQCRSEVSLRSAYLNLVQRRVFFGLSIAFSQTLVIVINSISLKQSLRQVFVRGVAGEEPTTKEEADLDGILPRFSAACVPFIPVEVGHPINGAGAAQVATQFSDVILDSNSSLFAECWPDRAITRLERAGRAETPICFRMLREDSIA